MELTRSVLISILIFSALVSSEVIDKIVAVVGDDIILKSEVEQYAEQKKMFGASGSEQEIEEQSLEDLISVKILYDIAKKDTTIVVTDEEVQRVLDDRINPIIKEVGGEKEFEKIYKTTVSDLKRHYRSEIRKNILVERLKERYNSGITVTRKEVESFFENNKDSIPDVKPSVTLSQLLVSFSNEALSDNSAREKAESIKSEILQGEISFEDAAEKYSEDETSKYKGGNIGTTKRGDLVPSYERSAYNLEQGDISEPVKTEYGYHIIKLNDKTGEKIDTSHILITPQASEQGDRAAFEYANSIRDSILNKKMTFEEAVKKHSDDEESRINDGMIGSLNIEDMDETYHELFKDAGIGYITRPVKDKSGYILYKVVDKRHGHKINLQEDYNLIRNYTVEYKSQREIKNWIEELRKKVYIEYK
ncbi:MAG: peptidylprolyl isomerase [Candidatus Delongbacteria bacterium]